MPTYDYQCDACGHTFEEFQKITDEPLTKCPQCKKKKLRRLIGTGAAIVFKGSGFYQTDYRSESYRKAAASEQPAGNETAAGKSDKSSADGSTTKPTDSNSPSNSTDSPSPKSKSRRKPTE
ncbi:MAG TPA: zinc ribbon domain-containing protein [Pirellulaceae bacterium]|nr:zinc ribbon domain-containing protein [Pirellulaceae bacterium]